MTGGWVPSANQAGYVKIIYAAFVLSAGAVTSFCGHLEDRYYNMPAPRANTSGSRSTPMPVSPCSGNTSR